MQPKTEKSVAKFRVSAISLLEPPKVGVFQRNQWRIATFEGESQRPLSLFGEFSLGPNGWKFDQGAIEHRTP